MILPWRHCVLLVLLCVTNALADEPFNCVFDLSGVHYDMNILNEERSISRDRPTPPSTMHDELRFNICGDLKQREGVKEGDQCGQGTRACFTTTNKKKDENDRVVSAIPVAQSSNKFSIEAFSSGSGKGLTLIMNAGSYPNDGGKPQSLKLTMTCTTQTQEPKLTGYDGSQVTAEWSVVEACGVQKSNDPPSSGGSPSTDDGGGSSMGWFFFILLLIVVAYFGLGAYHNYNQYGASGWDLVPHRDFWRDVPYLIRDLISHLFSSGRSSRGGYTSV